MFEKLTNSKGKLINRDKVTEVLVHFQNAFDEFKNLLVEIKELQFTKKKATINVDVSYTAYQNATPNKMKGESTFKFRKDYLSYWQICSFAIPGIKL